MSPPPRGKPDTLALCLTLAILRLTKRTLETYSHKKNANISYVNKDKPMQVLLLGEVKLFEFRFKRFDASSILDNQRKFIPEFSPNIEKRLLTFI